jgi:predicted DNA-binding transcriptional regulator AlpA
MTTTFDELGILRLPQVMQLVGLGRTTIYDMMGKGIFPRRYPLVLVL